MTVVRNWVLLALIAVGLPLRVAAAGAGADAPAVPTAPPPAALPPDHPPIVATPAQKKAPIAITAELLAKLPAPANRPVDFVKDIKPLFDASCVQCHAKGKTKGGLSMETRDALLKGGASGPAVVPGKSADSRLVHMVAALDPDNVMPMKGTRWTADQVALVRAWIDQGANWEGSVTFARPAPLNLRPRPVVLPDGSDSHPVDRIVSAYFAAKGVTAPTVVDDATFARRAYFDVIGLPPRPAQLEDFVNDKTPDKRALLVRQLLADDLNYADHWLSFWNDLLRNDYKGTGYIDGGRKQITNWLYAALLTNKPYNEFVAELVNPVPASEGFTKGIIWRGSVNASMTPQMQAAQNVSQVLMGVNLKCAGCHDSFVSDWSLADAYGFAALFADKPLEMVQCDKPTGQIATPRFIYPQLGAVDERTRAGRLKQLAEIMTSPNNGRVPRTIVNRLWAKLTGRGLVEPLDDMDKPAWDADLLDWLAEDLVANKYDLKHTLELILTSRAYQLPPVARPADGDKSEYVFRGPYTRRLSAEQFADAVGSLSGQWADFPSSNEVDFSAGGKVVKFTLPTWIWTDEPLEPGVRRGAWQLARAKMDEAQSLAMAALKAVADGAPDASAAAEKAKAAAEAAARLMVEADAIIQSPERAAQVAAAPEKLAPGVAEIVRHKVVFRKKFTVDGPPYDAYAAVAASQRVTVVVNGKPVTTVRATPDSNGRAAVLDLRPHLVQGDNVVVISVDSHTERPGAKANQPQLTQHLNGRSGVAFYARYWVGGQALELMTDATWKVRRAPEVDPTPAAFDDAPWMSARQLKGPVPMDEGPVLEPSGKPSEPGMDLGQRLPAAVAGAVRAGHIRAALRTSNPLLVALDRPNREVVVPVRSDVATTFQALELTNGATLDQTLKAASTRLVVEVTQDPAEWVADAYLHALARKPTEMEKKAALEALGQPVKPEGIADVLWALSMLPEFQLLN